MPEKVLFFTYWYPNRNNKSSGIFTKRHAQAIALNHHLIVLSLVITKGKSLLKTTTSVFTDEQGVETHQLYLESVFYKLLYVMLPVHYFILKRYILKNLMQHSFTILHSNVIFPCGIVGYWLSETLHLKHVITEHWTKIDKFFKVSLYRFAAKKALNAAAGLSFVSQQLADTVRKYTNNPRYNIVPNVIDGKEFYYDPSAKKNETFTFIAAAHWAQFKNPFYFLEALKIIADQHLIPTFKVVLAGSGEQLEKVKNNNYPFEIDFKGNLNPKELNLALNKSHIFLHGSDFETFSVIIAEALMCGLPCVVSPYGIALEAIHADNGFVTDNTINDWKDKILACYNTSYDNKMISEQLKNRYSLEAISSSFSALYKQLAR